MSLDYTLYMQTELKPAALLDEFADINRLEKRMENRVGEGVVVSASAVHPLTQEMVEEAYGFKPTNYLYFSIDKFESHDQGLATTVFGSIALLNQISGDAVLDCSYDEVVLARLGGKLRLNSKSSFWSEQSIIKVGVPSTPEELPDIN